MFASQYTPRNHRRVPLADEAFTRTLSYLGISDINLLLADVDALTKVLQYHVLPTPVPSSAITEDATTVNTLG